MARWHNKVASAADIMIVAVCVKCLADRLIPTKPQFISTSVTAGRWVPLAFVPKTELRTCLQEARRSGSTVVGVGHPGVFLPYHIKRWTVWLSGLLCQLFFCSALKAAHVRLPMKQ